MHLQYKTRTPRVHSALTTFHQCDERGCSPGTHVRCCEEIAAAALAKSTSSALAARRARRATAREAFFELLLMPAPGGATAEEEEEEELSPLATAATAAVLELPPSRGDVLPVPTLRSARRSASRWSWLKAFVAR